MSLPLTIKFKPTILDRTKELTINADYLEIDEFGEGDDYKIKIEKKELVAWRYGVKFISGYKFNIGRIYCIDLKTTLKKEVKIRLKSIYGIRKTQLSEKYLQIAHSIQDNFMSPYTIELINHFKEFGEITINGIILTRNGLIWEKKGREYPWNDIGTRDYANYYSIYSLTNPNNYKAFYYLHDWNTSIINNLIETTLDEMKLKQ